jgi:hypothetical protein
LKTFVPAIQALAHKRPTVMEDANLLWRICHSVIRQYQSEHPEWIFLRHEDLSREPLHRFAALFGALHLEFGETSRAFVMDHCFDPGPRTDLTADGEPYSVKRNSASNLWQWRVRLTKDEIALACRDLEDFEYFYPEPEWRV